MATWYIGYEGWDVDVPTRHQQPYWIKCGKHDEGFGYDTLDECFAHFFAEADHEPLEVVDEEQLGTVYDYMDRRDSPTIYVCGRGAIPLYKLSDEK